MVCGLGWMMAGGGLPAVHAQTTVSFQQGVSGYSGAVDAWIGQAWPTTDYSTADPLEWDGEDNGGQNSALIRFGGIFGAGPGQVPPGSFITSAVLSYQVTNNGNAGAVNEVAIDWLPPSPLSYNSFGPQAGVQASDYGASVGSASGTTGPQSLDVTASLSAWSLNPALNRGWIIRPTGTDGVQLASSENATVASRPKLTVTYVAVTGVTFLTTDVQAVVGSGNVNVNVVIPAGANASNPVQVTLTSANPAVADLVGAVGGALTLTFAVGAPTSQSASLQLLAAGSTTIGTSNDAGLSDDSLLINLDAGAVNFELADLPAIPGTRVPVKVAITAGSNATRNVQVTLTSSAPAVALPTGASGNALTVTFASGGPAQQIVPVDIGQAGAAMLTTTNNGGLDNDTLAVEVSSGFRFTAGADPRHQAARYSGLLAAIQAQLGGPGAFHLDAGDIDPLQPLRDALDANFGPQAIWFPVIGNHEAETADDMTWLRDEYHTGHGVRTPLKNHTLQNGPAGSVETSYAWEQGHARLIALNQYWNGNTTPGSDTQADGQIVPALQAWLEQQLRSAVKPVLFVVGHEPAYPQIRHIGDSLDQYPAQRDAYWQLLEREGVLAYLCGHTHFYSRLQTSPDGPWQLDLGNAGNDSAPGDPHTFAQVTVNQSAVRYDIYRSTAVGSSTYNFYESWTQPIPIRLVMPVRTVQRSVWIGSSLGDDALDLTGVGPATVHYTAEDNADWLSVTPGSGDSTGETDQVTLTYEGSVAVADLPAGVYPATVTIDSPEAVNGPIDVAVTLTVQTVGPDQDGDGDVDLDDFGIFQFCLSGSNIAQNRPECQRSRLDQDTDVDFYDLQILLNCVSGADIAAEQDCMNP